MMGRSPRRYIPSFVEISPLVRQKMIFEGVLHILVWQPSWSCDPDAVNKLLYTISSPGEPAAQVS